MSDRDDERRRLAWCKRLGQLLFYLVPRVLGALALSSALIVGALRWVDPPTSSFMVRQALVAWRAGRQAPAYYHTWVPWGRIPPVVPLAVIAGEDQRFADHHGFDAVEIRRALAGWQQGDGLRGASTITQQTAKNLFLWPERSWVRKGLEAWFAGLIEFLWPKQRILEVYLNIVQFSPSTYGVGAASERYFNRPVEALTQNEAALLAAVLPAPSVHRLDRPSARLQRRAQWIADQIQRLGGRRYLGRL
ncbi:MAG TPA: monofunctional biosynthetic peptidoglycan transglycosylase [Lamprocystis sp. (in: g-proteobacteria)]|nr:monofunctional biosynthetic peptidoglycan transglycosylase [Lamprocystis sp. (in: g-proteobacteria)]